MEMCEDVWVPIPPSSFAALAGATVIGNLSASNMTIGKSEYRHSLIANQSARCIAAYLYAAAGPGESTTDLAWDGHAMIYENGNLLAESQRFPNASQLILADIDLDRLTRIGCARPALARRCAPSGGSLNFATCVSVESPAAGVSC